MRSSSIMPPMGPDSGGSPIPTPMGSGSGAYSPPMEPRPGASPPLAPQVTYVVKSRPKWHALRTIADILKVFAWITAGFDAIAVIFALITGSHFGNLGFIGALLFGIATAIGAGFAFLGMYSCAEIILVMVSIEENTRKV